MIGRDDKPLRVTGNVEIDPDLIPQSAIRRFAKKIIPQVEDFFDDPKNMAEYEAWLAEHQKKKSVQATSKLEAIG